VRPSEISCREHRQGHGLGISVTETTAFAADRIVEIAEARGTTAPLAVPELQRLEHLRGPLPSAGAGTARTVAVRPVGFHDDLVHTAVRAPDVELIGRLYGGA
jgi:hypothetical protein